MLKPGPDFVISDSSRPRPLAIRVAFEDVSVLTGEALDDGSALASLSEAQGEKLMSSVLYLRSIEMDDSTRPFLRAVSPRALIIGESVPLPADKDMREALKNISVFDTSTDGEITLESDGSGRSVETYAGEKKLNLQ